MKQSIKKGEDPHHNKVTGINKHGSLTTLNINGPNSSIKRHRLIDKIRKQDQSFCCNQETHLTIKGRHHFGVKGWKKIFQTKKNQEASRYSYFNIWQNRLQSKTSQKRQGRALYNPYRKNPHRGYCNSKHVCTKHKGSTLHLNMNFTATYSGYLTFFKR